MSGAALPGDQQVLRYDDADHLAVQVAQLVSDRLVEAQRERDQASLVLTGGTIARKVHQALAVPPSQGSVDWGQVEVFWGDERYVPTGDDERNAGQARADLLDRVPVDPRRVHEMPAEDGGFADAEAAAAAYAEVLPTRAGAAATFDVLMLGIGPDGHCASLFPGRPEVTAEDDVMAVREAPKPPPTRITLGMAVLRSARHVIFVASGAEKADAVARSVAGDDVRRTPAAGPRGLVSTTWMLDAPAASQL